jgi:hypothetical protein
LKALRRGAGPKLGTFLLDLLHRRPDTFRPIPLERAFFFRISLPKPEKAKEKQKKKEEYPFYGSDSEPEFPNSGGKCRRLEDSKPTKRETREATSEPFSGLEAWFAMKGEDV